MFGIGEKSGIFSGLLLAFVAMAPAQVRDTASLFGTVSDPASAFVASAKVSVTNVSTGLSRSAVTDASGGFVFPLLPVGSYSLTVEQSGFHKYERRNIVLQTNENIRIDVSLEVGNVTEAVTVTTETSQVDTRAATLNHTVDSKRVVELPLNGRNPADLVLLAPGVTPVGGNTGDQGGSAWRPRGQKEVSVNGSRNNNLRYTLDGGTNMDDLVNDNLDFPFPDAVQEFSAQTSNMGVELGGLSGGALNVVTKSGTNSLHGDVFWFVRNTALNASNFFSRGQDQLKRNQYGFTVGGPFIKNKLFGFMGYQKLTIRQATGNIRELTLTAAERRGDFSSNPIRLHDPLSTSGALFPNNTIPASRFSPASVKLLSLSPLPDADGFVRYIISQPDDGLQGIGKLDYVMNAKNNFVFRVFESDADQPFHSPPDNIHAARYGGIKESRNATLGHTFILNSNTVAHTQFTVAHQLANIATDFPLTTAGLGVQLNPNGNHIDITMAGSGVSFNAPLHAIRFGRGSLEVQHDWSMNKGNHSLVWGTSIVRKRFNNNTLFH